MADIDISHSNVYISVLNPDRIVSIPGFTYIIKDTIENTISIDIDVSLTIITELNKLGTSLNIPRIGRNHEKGYTTYLKATNDITLTGLPNTIFAVPKENTTIKITKTDPLYFRSINTEGKIDFVATGQLDSIARITEGDYYINDFQNKLERGLDTSLNFDGDTIEFKNITQDTLISIHTDDAVTHSIFDISMIKLTQTQNKLRIKNYNNYQNNILTPIYLPNTSEIYFNNLEGKIAFKNIGTSYSTFNIFSVINNKKHTEQGKYTFTTQSGYYFAFGNKNKEDKIVYKSGVNSLQEKVIITDNLGNDHEYLFISGTIELYVNDDFGNIDMYGFRQVTGTTVLNIITTKNALVYGSLNNLIINNGVDETSIQNTNIFTYSELFDYKNNFATITNLSTTEQTKLFDLTEIAGNKKKLDIKYGTTNVENGLFEKESISILKLPETLISIGNAVNNNPIEKALLPTSISYELTDISNIFATNTTDISLVIYNVSKQKYYLSTNSQSSIKTDLSSLDTGEFILAPKSILEYFDILPSKIVSLDSYSDGELQGIGIDVSYTISNNVDLSFNLGNDNSFIIQQNEFANIDLSTVILPLTTTHIGEGAFANNNLKTIDLSGLTRLIDISENAFNNNSITSVDFTKVVNLQKIHNNAFNRNRITSVNLSQSTNLTEINDYAFYGSPITSLTLPQSLIKIGKYAFGFNKITDLTLLGDISIIDEGAFAFGTIQRLDISGLSLLTTIGKYGFANNDISENIHFPVNLRSVGVHAFSKNAIPKIVYNDKLSNLGYGSFQENKLNNIDLSLTRISEIPNYTFYDNSYYDNSYLKLMYLPKVSSFSKIGRNAFEKCFITNKQTIQSSVTEINRYAFLNNKISDLDLSNANGLKLLDEGIFKNNDMSGTTLIIPKNVEIIALEAFNNSGISQVNFENFKTGNTINNSVPKLKRILNKSFHNNNITGVLDLYSYKLELIDKLAFDTNRITQVNFNINNPNFRTSDSAFTNNPITRMEFPLNWRLKTIGFGSVFIQKTLLYPYTRLIDPIVGGYTANEIDTILDSSDNIWLYTISNGILTVNDYTESIGENAFKNMPDISGLILNNDLKEINNFAFYDCSLNGKITLPRDISSIGESAFEKNNITELDMSGSTQLTTIGASAFNYNKMEIVNFTGPMPKLTRIGAKSFGNNSNLKTINFGKITNATELVANNGIKSVFINTPKITSGIFPFENDISINLPTKIRIDIGFAQKKLRLTIDQLLKFGYTDDGSIDKDLNNIEKLWLYNIDNSGVMNIIPGVSSVADDLFEGKTNITKIIVPSSVNNIGNNTFRYNTNLEVLELINASGLTYIGENAFSYTSIKTLNLSSCLPNLTIGTNAFSDNSDLSFVDFTNMTNDTKLNENDGTDSGFPFFNCPGLKDVTIFSNDISLNLHTIGFPVSFTQEKLLYPINKLEEYQYTDAQIDRIIDNSNNVWLYTLETKTINTVNSEVLTIQEGVRTVNDEVFKDVTINKLILPFTIETIGKSSFANASMNELDMSKAVRLNTIGESAFNNNNFTTLDFSTPTPALLRFGNLSFANNSSLTSAHFGDLSDNATLNTNGETSVFYNTPNFRSMTVRDDLNMKKIGFSIDFAQQRMLIKINDLSNNNGYSLEDIDTVLTNINDIWLYSLYTGVLTIIDGVTRIEDGAFKDNNDIQKIVFPSDNTLEYIGANSFANCNINTSLTIPSRVETIGYRAFYNNSISDLSFSYGNYLTTISGEAFSSEVFSGEAFNYNKYTKLIMKDYTSLRLIGTKCFANNPALERIDFRGSSKNVKFESDVFINDTGLTTILIPFYWNPNEVGLLDSDYDKVINIYDKFPYDPYETRDTDGDGVGDNADAFPYDPYETTDTDRDGVGDNADIFPYNPLEKYDTNNDGMGDNMTSYLKTVYAEHYEKVKYDFRKYKTGKLPGKYSEIRGRNLTLVPLDIITVSNEIIEDVSENIIVPNEILHCVGKLQPNNINHHHSYKTYIQDRNKDYTQREFNFKSKQQNGSVVILNDPTTTCKSTHKPNNKQYGIQGATSASNKIAKEKNSNITQNAVTRMPENDKEIYIDSTKCVNQTIVNFGRVKRVKPLLCTDENNV